MQTITVKRTIKAPIEKIFDILSDHANYKSFPGVRDSKLIREGKTDRNGVGAQREINAGAAWFVEEITAFERPVRMDYVIIKSRPPIEHQGGSIRLERKGDSTAVTWTSTMRVSIPVIGGLITKLAAPKLGSAFGGMLKEVERRLAA